MSTSLNYKDKYGSYQLSIEHGIICAIIEGAVGESFSRRYNQDFCALIAQLDQEKWGHYADFTLCEAMTEEAQHKSIELHNYAILKGCVASAYQISSALLTSQVNSVRQASHLPLPINQRIFATKSECMTFINNELADKTNS
ncbi:hypothetical protein [Paraglaciecola sp. 25GB23A]|uniref:hypothetical protein n=1 Tax=Paraglaciecola sp. 25GB23A TaxID=3156068 RepID=UPI0032AEA70F